MTTVRSLALLALGIVFCIGCGDSSSQSWETGKSQSSGHKKIPKVADTADNDAPVAADESEAPHKMVNPHGAMNPHGGMQLPEGDSGAKLENNGKLDIDTVHFTVPKSWIAKAHSAMLQAEYGVPRAEGDKEDGRLTVSQLGGTLEENVARWKQQFGEKPEKENEETIDVGGIKIVVVDFSGTYNDSRGMMGPTVARPDYRLLGAIFQIPGEEGLHFIKCYGPKKTVTARADEIKEFLRSLKVDK